MWFITPPSMLSASMRMPAILGRAFVGDPQVLQLPILNVADQDGFIASAACDFGQGQALVPVGTQHDRRLGRTAAAQRERPVVDRAAFDENRIAGLP